MKEYKSIIIDSNKDDARLVVSYIKRFCPRLKIEGVAATLAQARLLYNHNNPHIMFIDVVVDGEMIFSFLDAIEDSSIQLIFICSEAAQAVKAIKYDAVDFVMKPVKMNDLIGAVSRAVLRLDKEHGSGLIQDSKIQFIAVSTHYAIDLIRVKDILYAESEGRYTKFYIQNKGSVICSKNIGEYEKLLRRNKFFRIHKSYLVNLNKIVQIKKNGSYYCKMPNNKNLVVSKRKQTALNKLLKL